jgi:hypothetical protein
MAELPERFRCVVPDWAYIDRLAREVAVEVREARFEPDAVIALARGGWVGARVACDVLDIDDLISLKVEHYVGTARASDEPTVRYPVPDGSVRGKGVLVLDDIADTGSTLDHATDHVAAHHPSDVRTGTLQLLPESAAEPDFVGDRLDEFAWVIYPWNFVEDMVELTAGVMAKADEGPYTRADLRRLLEAYHEIGHIELEVAQPGRLGEVLDAMERRGVAERTGDRDGEPAWRPT